MTRDSSHSRDSQGPVVSKGSAGLQRRLSDEEIRSVLRDAAELQVGHGVAGGLTVDELRSVAAEAGIAPEFIDSALAALTSSTDRVDARDKDGGYQWHRRRLVPGAVPLENLDRILHVVRKTFGPTGKLNLISGRLEWSRLEGSGISVVVGVTGRGSATEIDLVADRSLPHGITHVALPLAGLVVAVIVAAALGASGLAMLVLAGLGGVGGHFAARRIWSRYAAAYAAKLDASLERVASEAAAQARSVTSHNE